jgi:hypothetical protein
VADGVFISAKSSTEMARKDNEKQKCETTISQKGDIIGWWLLVRKSRAFVVVVVVIVVRIIIACRTIRVTIRFNWLWLDSMSIDITVTLSLASVKAGWPARHIMVVLRRHVTITTPMIASPVLSKTIVVRWPWQGIQGSRSAECGSVVVRS